MCLSGAVSSGLAIGRVAIPGLRRLRMVAVRTLMTRVRRGRIMLSHKVIRPRCSTEVDR